MTDRKYVAGNWTPFGPMYLDQDLIDSWKDIATETEISIATQVADALRD